MTLTIQLLFCCKIQCWPIILLLGADARVGATFGQGKGPIFLYNVHCWGTELRLSDCARRADGLDKCAHFQDAGVVCSGT